MFNRLSTTLSYRYTAPTVGLVSATPAVGAGAVIYAASNAGYVYAFDNTLNELWKISLGTSFDTSPALDCGPRLADGGVNPGPGTLYLAGTGSGALYAIIVDSRGLDPTAPWPRFQRDTRNTGSVETPVIASGTCQ
ncbi:MAG: cell surface protein [Myxococcaceae bacterium]|nr:cell surface protein [Myxococcaceae bacterium]